MAFFKARVGEKLYELDKLTLGEARILKRDFGLIDLEYFSPGDPDQLVGLLALALRRGNPSMTLEQATAEAEGIDIEEFEGVADDEDPTPAAVAATDGEDVDAQPESGKSAKPQKKTGKQS